MKSLQPLLRLNKWKVDEKSRALGVLLEETARIQALDDTLVKTLEHEKEIALTPEGAAAFANYIQQTIRRRQQLANEIARLESKVQEARDALRDAMGEAKKIEVADEQRKSKEAAEEKSRETQMLDDVALTGFRRAQEEEG